MALTLTYNPVGSANRKLFAGFQPCEFVFKREDLAVTSVDSGAGGKARINHAGDLSSYLSAGDTVYLYSETADYVYDGSFEIISIVAGQVTVDTPYIQTGTGGYINYFKNYYVELQCVNPTLPAVNILPFSLESDGDAAGNVKIDVSIINELNRQRGGIDERFISESVTEFEVRYRQVYQGSSESFTLVDDKLLIMLYAIDVPEADSIINNFDVPKLFLGYPGAVVAVLLARPTGSTCKMVYNEKGINGNVIDSGTLGTQGAAVNGFLQWEWEPGAAVQPQTRYIEFNFEVIGIFDYDPIDYDSIDYLTS